MSLVAKIEQIYSMVVAEVAIDIGTTSNHLEYDSTKTKKNPEV